MRSIPHVLASLVFISSLVFVQSVPTALAQRGTLDEDYLWDGNSGADVRGTLALGDRDPREVLANIINIVLGFLGIIAVIIILASGFRYMTSGGNEEQKATARNSLIAAIIGLVIILSAYSLASFVINSVLGATTGS